MVINHDIAVQFLVGSILTRKDSKQANMNQTNKEGQLR